MCGGGIRAVRYALEVPGVAHTVAVDLDQASSETAKRTASLSSASVDIRYVWTFISLLDV
jgi:tRNA G26 N,N-dimethylase Trm1